MSLTPASGPAQQPDGHDDDVALFGVGVRHRLIEVPQRVVVADGHEHAAGARVQLLEAHVGFAHQLELIFVLLVRGLPALRRRSAPT